MIGAPDKAASVDDRRMVQFIGKNQVVFPDQRRNRGDIRIESRLKGNRRFDPFEARELLLQLRVQGRGPGNGAYGRRSDAERSIACCAACRSRGSLANPR